MELELAFDFILLRLLVPTDLKKKGLIKNKEVIEQCRVYHTLAH